MKKDTKDLKRKQKEEEAAQEIFGNVKLFGC